MQEPLSRSIQAAFHIYGFSQTTLAMLSQGAASWVQAVEFFPESESWPPAIGICSALGKIFLIYYYNMDNLNKLARMTQDRSWFRDFWNLSKLRKLNLLVGLVPGTVFGCLVPITLDKFIEVVHHIKPGHVFDTLAEWAAYPSLRWIFGSFSFMGNLIASPVFQILTIMNIYNLYKEVRGGHSYFGDQEYRGLQTGYDYARFALGTSAGLAFSVAACIGFSNFFGLADIIAQNYLDFPNWLAAIYSGIQLVYMFEMGFISGMPLGKNLVESCLDIGTAQYEFPEYKNIFINTLAAAGAVAICAIGGFPNVWQALYVGQTGMMPWFAEAASFITELYGSYLILNIAITKLTEWLSCQPCHAPEPQQPPAQHQYQGLGQRDSSSFSFRDIFSQSLFGNSNGERHTLLADRANDNSARRSRWSLSSCC